jgi:uncharacterized membrane protein
LRIKPETDLAVISILSILLIIIVAFFESNVLRIVLGLPFILFFPGYTLVAALFPRKVDLAGLERIALSFGLSIAVVPLVGLILNYTPWGIELYPILVSITIVILVTSGVAWYRRHRLPEDECFAISFNLNLSQWTAMKGWDKVLSIILVASILGAIGAIAYVIVTPKTGEKFTEFYVLGLDGEASNYPSELVVGEEGSVILVIVNHEHEDDLTYRVEILVDGEVNGTIGPLALNHDERWESEVGFVPQDVGDDQKVEFILYKNGEDEPYSSLHLWIDVKNTS